MTKRSGSRERAVIRSSVMPSLKYSWPWSPLMLVKGKTAIDGVFGKGRAGGCAGGMDAEGVGGRNERCWTNKTVAVDLLTVDHHVAQIHADAEFHPALG